MADALLAEVELLAHPVRHATLARFALANDVKDIIADLESRGRWYEQVVAATLANVSGDTTWAAAHLTNLCNPVRCKALKLAPRLSDAVIKDALNNAPKTIRYVLYRQLKARPALADQLIEAVRAEWGEDEATHVLLWCSEPIIHHTLPSLLRIFARAGAWGHLAKRHPNVLQQILIMDLKQTVEVGMAAINWWEQYSQAFVALLKHSTTAKVTLHVIEDNQLPSDLIHSHLHIFFRQEPEGTLSYLLKHNLADYVIKSPRTCRRIVRSGLPQIQELTKAIGAYNALWMIRPYLKCFPPFQRVKNFELAYGGRRPCELLQEGIWEKVDFLPKAYSLKTFGKYFPNCGATSTERLHFPLEYLDQEEVEGESLKGLNVPDSCDRGTAWEGYIANAEFNGSQALVKVTGEAARRLRNDQKRVRLKAIHAFLKVPALLWNTTCLGHLTTILQAEIEAPDTGEEWRLFKLIAANVLGAHIDSAAHVSWVRKTFDTLIEHGGTAEGPDSSALVGDQVVKIWNFYKPYMAKEAAYDTYSILFQFVMALDHRADNMPELQEAIWKVITNKCGSDFELETAIRCWLGNKSLRWTRVADLLTFDPSTVNLPITAAHLSQLQKTILDPDTTGRKKKISIKRLKDAPGGLELARALATDETNGIFVVEKCFSVLSTSPADLGFLYSFAGSNFAHTAQFVAAGAAHRERPSVLEPYLANLLTRKDVKVTSKTEAVRQVLLHLPLNTSIPLLVKLSANFDLHRDVRIACVTAAVRTLSVDAAWDAIRNSLATGDPFVKIVLCKVSPLDLAVEHRRRYAPFVILLAQDEDVDVRRAAVESLAKWAVYSPDAGTLLVAMLTDMTAFGRVWEKAADSLVEWGDRQSLLSALSTLIVYPDHRHHRKTEDMPAVRRIETIMDRLRNKLSDKWYHPTINAVLDFLAGHSDYIPHAARLRMKMFEFDNPVQLLKDLRDLARLLSNRSLLAYQMYRRIIIEGHKRTEWPSGMSEVARELVNDSGANASLFALALIDCNRQQGREGWTDEWLKMLWELRRHGNADVRDEARSMRVD
ncbi:uncharacterized protein CcaverHIS019_0103410 [Cutaneotrichosporon cavernicola]|uniref:ARM repeat-containing protein n=1 Tax=Cutaneotrichosporon cavernicola TaxID=279322 RepID=A0AA48L1W6_9TREE|nr:uncharacterized protein CcaverHIS019_0103410 [Cutaneotrichosporon cavernicola]BEI87623.1 hypothetical protein CcaverHIS019_0103410 [Cutaneotrichosporon cavernicola]